MAMNEKDVFVNSAASKVDNVKTEQATKQGVQGWYDRHTSGNSGGSWNMGDLNCMAYKHAYRGEKIHSWREKRKWQMNTPNVANHHKITMTIEAYEVPHSLTFSKQRMAKGTAYDLFIGNKNTSGYTKPTMPTINLNNRIIIGFNNVTGTSPSHQEVQVTDSHFWRQMFASDYIPRSMSSSSNIAQTLQGQIVPATQLTPTGALNASGNTTPADTRWLNLAGGANINVLKLRGYWEIYNNHYADEETETITSKYTNNTVSNSEAYSYGVNNNGSGLCIRADDFFGSGSTSLSGANGFKRQVNKRKNYYTNYTTNNSQTGVAIGANMFAHNQLQQAIADYRRNDTNTNKTDDEIVAEMRGTRPITIGNVTKIASREIGLNYKIMAQTANNNGEGINADSSVLGATGGTLLGEIDIELFKNWECKEDCYIHIMYFVQVDPIPLNGVDKEDLYTLPTDFFREDLKDIKDDTLLQIEWDISAQANSGSGIIGYKQKYNELDKLPCRFSGDQNSMVQYLYVTNGVEPLPTPIDAGVPLPSGNIWNLADVQGYGTAASYIKDNSQNVIQRNQALQLNTTTQMIGWQNGQSIVSWGNRYKSASTRPTGEKGA